MALQVQPHGPTAEQAYYHAKAAPFYQILPLDVLRLICEYVATGKNRIEAAKNAVALGQVDWCFHAISHELPMDYVIKFVATPKEWRKNEEESDKMWPRTVMEQVDHIGRVIQRYTTGGIRL